MKWPRKHSFSEEISSMCLRSDWKELHHVSLKLISDQIAVNLKVLHAFMKDKVSGNIMNLCRLSEELAKLLSNESDIRSFGIKV